MRIHINMPDELLKQVDAQADALYISRTAFITMCVVNKLQNDKMMNSVDMISQAIQDFKQMGEEQRELVSEVLEKKNAFNTDCKELLEDTEQIN